MLKCSPLSFLSVITKVLMTETKTSFLSLLFYTFAEKKTIDEKFFSN